MYSIEDAIIDSQGLKGIKNQIIREGGMTLLRNLKNKFGIGTTIVNSGDIATATKWIRHYDKRFKHHIENPYSLMIKRDNENPIINSDFIIGFGDKTFLFVSGRWTNDNEGDLDLYLYLYFFGKGAFKWFKKFTHYIEKAYPTCGNRTYSITAGKNPSGNETYWTCVGGFYDARPIDSIYMNQKKRDLITTHLDKWLKNEDLYRERGIIFKTGILLYGNAGTGKSSMATAIATYLQCGMIIIDTTTFHDLNISELTESINADNNMYVILIDEIDSIFVSRDSEKLSEKQNENTTKLLSFLDSPQSPTNVVFVATTNYRDRLDKALLRKGRFDLEIELNDIDKDCAFKMCKGFGLSDSDATSLLDDKYSGSTSINPSELQLNIISTINHKEDEVSNQCIH